MNDEPIFASLPLSNGKQITIRLPASLETLCRQDVEDFEEFMELLIKKMKRVAIE
jgi:hypothetical protein